MCERARRSVISRLLFVLPAFLLLFASCKKQEEPKPGQQPAAASGPNIKATVLTIQSTMGDAPASTHDVLIAKGRARSTEEIDSWRLFDTNRDEVTFVDDLAKTYTTVPFEKLLAHRTAANARALDPDLQRADVAASGKTQQLQGVNASETIIKLGAYERRLWIGTPSTVPPQLFAMMQLSNPPTSSLAPVMRDVDAHIAKLKGFALSETTQLPYGKKKLAAQRNVTAIASKDVPAVMFEIPKGYKNVAYVAPPLPAAARRDLLPATPLSPATAAPLAPVTPAPAVTAPAPVVAKPAAPKPAAPKPAAKPAPKPAVKKTVAAKPAVRKPAVKKPPAKPPVRKPAVKKPPAKKPTVKPAAKPRANTTAKRTPPKRAPKPAPKPPAKKRTPPKKRG